MSHRCLCRAGQKGSTCPVPFQGRKLGGKQVEGSFLQPSSFLHALSVRLCALGIWTAGTTLPVASQCPQDEVATLWGLQRPDNLARAHLCSLASLSSWSHPPLPSLLLHFSISNLCTWPFTHSTRDIGTDACSFNLHRRYSVLSLVKFLPALSLRSHPHSR